MRRNLSVLVPALVIVFAFALSFCARSVSAQTFTESTFYTFCSTGGEDCTDGVTPPLGAQLIQAADGNLWGVTTEAGTAGNIEGWGTLYKITPSGTLTVVHSFCSEGAGDCTEGGIPRGGVIQGPDGNIWGTTSFTGAAGGTVFKVTPSGTLTTVFTFCTEGGSCPNGSLPSGSIIFGSDGNLYGTTYYGGTDGQGTIYKLTPSGTLTTLYNFPNPSTVRSTPNGLLEASDGNFYGVQPLGGTGDGGSGTLFKLTPAGKYSTIYNFCSSANCADGQFPRGPQLVEASDGNFYAATYEGGTGIFDYNQGGIAFSMSPTGSESVLYNYCLYQNSGGNCSDGEQPAAGVFLAGDGNFYGTTEVRGPSGNSMGTISSLGTVLYGFCAAGGVCTDGSSPEGTVIQGSDGSLYGTTFTGGTNANCRCGVIWKLKASPALPAPVQLTLSSTTVSPNESVTLSWKALNAFSNTMQQCYAFEQGSPSGAGTWTGKQKGTLSNKIFSGSASITPTKAGTYTYALTCGGIESGFATLTVSGTSKDSSTTTLSSTPNPATIGQTVSLKATVTGSGSEPTGSVSYSVTGIALGTASLNGSGVATLSASSNGQAPGTYPIIATYAGNSTYDGSASKAVNVTLNKAPTSTTLTASPTSVTPPADVTLTATVKRSTSGAAGVPTGTVSFEAEGVTFATAKLNGSGVATFKASSAGQAAGTYPIKAVYAGDASDTTSTSSTVNVTLK
jgi:uncharacterized repeat protein (TIGR03803 family)